MGYRRLGVVALLLIALSATTLLHAHLNGPPPGYTGAPGVVVVVAILQAQPASAKTSVVNSEDDASDANHGDGNRDMDSAGHRRRMNFTYTDGEKPWLSHIPSQINTTYEAVLSTHIYLSRYVCAGDSTDIDKMPSRGGQYVCLEGEGAKAVVPLGHPTWSHSIFASPAEGGFFEQKHMIKKSPHHYYDTTIKVTTRYFLIPFGDYEIPTYYPEESKAYLPIWRRLFKSMNGLTDEWFDAHIKVVGTYVMQGDFYGEQLRRFMVEYYYHFDWARLKLTDSFASRFGDTRLEDGIDSVVLEDAFKAYEEKLRSEGCPVVRRITKVKQLNGIASQDEIKSAVLTASPLLGFDVNRHLRVDRLGQLTLRCFGTIDWEANKCMRATVNLEDASVSGVTETACTIK